MATVSKEIADKVVEHNGVYPGDEHLLPYIRIVEYTNAWNGKSYGLETEYTKGKYAASQYVIDPKVYWERK